jgi:hypothetical protein
MPPEKFEIQAKAYGLRLIFEALYDLLDELPRKGLDFNRCSADQISELKDIIYVLRIRVDAIIKEEKLSTWTPDDYLLDT